MPEPIHSSWKRQLRHSGRVVSTALSQDQVRSSVTGLAGPPLGGVILAAGRALPFLACAVSFVVSFATALIVRIPPPEPAAPDGLSRRHGMFAGVSELWRNRMIRSAMTTMCIINIGGNALYLAVVVQLLHHGSSPRSIGIAMAVKPPETCSVRRVSARCTGGSDPAPCC